jgi:hypothetical protein
VCPTSELWKIFGGETLQSKFFSLFIVIPKSFFGEHLSKHKGELCWIRYAWRS